MHRLNKKNMITEEQKQKIKYLGHHGMMDLMNSHEPNEKCFVDYIIDNDGKRIYGSHVIDWGDCTQGQILTAEIIPT